jgi:O-acetyl-ADP-ribose deacetylase (regulator of RNase III)
MITYVVGDLFQSPARVLVNAVNTVGVMGKGVAEEFKRCYPEMFAQYKQLCESEQFTVGQLWLYKTPHKWILNFPTKAHWRDPSLLPYVEAGLQKFTEYYADKGITSISFPLLGCGAGGLDWEQQVRPLMEHYLGRLPINVYIHLYEPNNPFAPAERDFEAIRAWLNQEPETPTFAQFWDSLTRLILQKNSFQTVAMKADFQVAFDADERRNERRITVTPAQGESISVSESLLSEVWHYVRAAGYTLPHNLPGDIDAPYLVAMLTELSYFRPVLLSEADDVSQRRIGLQFVAPVSEVVA